MPETYLRKQRKALVGCIYLLSAFWGFHSALTREPPPVDLLLTIVIAIVVTLFCLVDAKIHQKPVPALAGWLILVTWPVSVPLCLFWLHGRRKSWRVLLFLVSVVAVCFVGAIVASVIAPS